MQKQAVVINKNDNVATAVANLAAGSPVSFFIGQDVQQIVLSEDIPVGHKFAIQDIASNQDIIKYGEVIGSSLTAITKGHHVHVHNIQSNRGRGDRK
ncbi:MAG: D-galactarate dehydratase [Gracilibacter sp. BRH_c7a]|nr:MAG: D-galactarate dehydratase [Gracilibacter sp. BRH_c7a]